MTAGHTGAYLSIGGHINHKQNFNVGCRSIRFHKYCLNPMKLMPQAHTRACSCFLQLRVMFRCAKMLCTTLPQCHLIPTYSLRSLWHHLLPEASTAPTLVISAHSQTASRKPSERTTWFLDTKVKSHVTPFYN